MSPATFAERYAQLSEDQKVQLFIKLHAQGVSKNMARVAYVKISEADARRLVNSSAYIDYWKGVPLKMNMNAPDPRLYDRDAKQPALKTLEDLFGAA